MNFGLKNKLNGKLRNIEVNGRILYVKMCATHLKQHVAYDEFFGEQASWK